MKLTVPFVLPDLSPIFHWNTKQLFVYITADYDHDSAAKGGRKIVSLGFLFC